MWLMPRPVHVPVRVTVTVWVPMPVAVNVQPPSLTLVVNVPLWNWPALTQTSVMVAPGGAVKVADVSLVAFASPGASSQAPASAKTSLGPVCSVETSVRIPRPKSSNAVPTRLKMIPAPVVAPPEEPDARFRHMAFRFFMAGVSLRRWDLLTPARAPRDVGATTVVQRGKK